MRSATRAMLPIDFAIFSPPMRRWAQCSQVRTNGWPVAASDWAISSSWCGNTRSTPPVWMSNEGPRWAMLMAEHSTCQPGRPGPIGVSQDGSPGLGPFHSAKSRTSSLPYSSASTRSPTRMRLRVETGQAPVGRPRGDPEEHGAVVGPVGVALREQRRDEVADLGDVRRSRAAGRPGASCPARPRRRGTGSRSGSASSVVVMPSAAAPRMILSSMSVRFITHVTRSPR